MNISKQLLCLSLLLSAPAALCAMDKFQIKEDYKPEEKDLSVTIAIQQANAATAKAYNTISEEIALIIKAQDLLAEEYQKSIPTKEKRIVVAVVNDELVDIIYLQNFIAEQDFTLQTRLSELRKKHKALYLSLPDESCKSVESAMPSITDEKVQSYLAPLAKRLADQKQQEEKQTTQSSWRPSFFSWFMPDND